MRRAGLTDEQIWDPRVVRPICRHHHFRFDHAAGRERIVLTEDQYPTETREYAAEHGFFWADERRGWIKGAE